MRSDNKSIMLKRSEYGNIIWLAKKPLVCGECGKAIVPGTKFARA